MSSSRIGSSITIDDNDKCSRIDKVRSEAEVLPNTKGYSTFKIEEWWLTLTREHGG